MTATTIRTRTAERSYDGLHPLPVSLGEDEVRAEELVLDDLTALTTLTNSWDAARALFSGAGRR